MAFNSAKATRIRCRAFLRLEMLEGRRLLAVGDYLGAIANPNESAQFGAEAGYAVSADGDFVAIGAPGEDLFGLSNVGQVHIYDRLTETLVRSIPNPSPASGDRFGEAVALSGNTLVVGTKYDDSTGSDSGQAAIFDVLTGQLVSVIHNPSPAPFDYFGAAVAIEGDTVVVAAQLDDVAGAMNAGSAYVYRAQDGVMLHELIRPVSNASDQFGSSLAISNNRIVVGVPRTDVGAVDAGSVEVFAADTGAFERSIANPTPVSFEFFGQDVDVSNDTLVVGVYSENAGAVNSGAAYLYDVTTGTLAETIVNPTPSLADNFGFAVAIDGETVVVGAYRDNTGANDAGSVYQYNATTGSLERTISNPAPHEFDYFGAAVDVAGGGMVAGAYWDDTQVQDEGAVYFFDTTTGLAGTTFFSPTPASFDFFGQSVAASNGLLAVGTVLDDSDALDAGSVQIFDTQNSNLLVSITNPTAAAGDNFGVSVALDNDLLVVGAHRDDADGIDSGIAYIFNAITGGLLHTLSNPSPNDQDNFGVSVAIDGMHVVVGAPGDDTDAVDNGAVYLFDAATGAFVRSFPNPSPDDFDEFGRAVSVSGELVVAGARFDDTQAQNSGAAYVFDASDGSLVSSLIDPFALEDDLFGESVSIAGTTVAVGVPRKDSGAVDAGVVNLFSALTGEHLHAIGSPIPTVGGFFGAALSMTDDLLTVGSSREDTTVTKAGAAYLFDTSTGTYIQRLVHPDPRSFDNFGFSITANEDIVAVGAPLVDGTTLDRGAVFTFAATNNSAPFANAGDSYLGFEGTLLTLDASGSTDVEDPLTSLLFEWDLDYDGAVFDVEEVGATIDVTFADNFLPRAIAVRVTDTGGLATIAETTLEILNVAPSIAADEQELSIPEGSIATNTGTIDDLGADLVDLSASVGVVVDLGNGTWSWSWTTIDGPEDSQTIDIVATDSDGADATASFALSVDNVAPQISVDEQVLSLLVGSLATNSGSYFDPGLDTVMLTASMGDVVDQGDGTWSWSLDTTGLPNSQTVMITATDSDGGFQTTAFELFAGRIIADSSAVSASEGSDVTNTGTYLDPGVATLTLSASIGDVVDNLDGTWTWNYNVSDGPLTEQVSISADYSSGETDSVVFEVTGQNLPPVLSVNLTEVQVDEGMQALNAGTVSDPGDDEISLSVSVGAILDHGDGTWSWSWDSQDGPDDSQTVIVTAIDSDGDTSTLPFELLVNNLAPEVSVNELVVNTLAGDIATNSGVYLIPVSTW